MMFLRYPGLSVLVICGLTALFSWITIQDQVWPLVSWGLPLALQLPGIARYATLLTNNHCGDSAIAAHAATAILELLATVVIALLVAVSFRDYVETIELRARTWYLKFLGSILGRMRTTVCGTLALALFGFVWFFAGSLPADRQISCQGAYSASGGITETILMIGIAQYLSLVCIRAAARRMASVKKLSNR